MTSALNAYGASVYANPVCVSPTRSMLTLLKSVSAASIPSCQGNRI